MTRALLTVIGTGVLITATLGCGEKNSGGGKATNTPDPTPTPIVEPQEDQCTQPLKHLYKDLVVAKKSDPVRLLNSSERHVWQSAVLFEKAKNRNLLNLTENFGPKLIKLYDLMFDQRAELRPKAPYALCNFERIKK